MLYEECLFLILFKFNMRSKFLFCCNMSYFDCGKILTYDLDSCVAYVEIYLSILIIIALF